MSKRTRSRSRPALAKQAQPGPVGACLLAAALTLPALQLAHAEAPPDYATIGFKYLSYRDSQPDQDRVRVKAPALTFMTPVAGDWSIAATRVVDSISGASPAYHTEAVTKMHDQRHAWDAAATRYFADGSLTVGATYSAESDYLSRGLSLSGTLSTEDKNTTWNFGLNLMHDQINPTNQIVQNESKNVRDVSLGLTRVLTMRDIAQIILGYSRGEGYFSDPYKIFDNRPRRRNHTTLLGRWNHHFSASGGSSHLSYRYYNDTYGIKAHTVSAEYVQPLPQGWTVTPAARLYSQSAANFYVDLDPSAAPFATNPPADAVYYSEEQRLSAFGARSIGIKLSKEFYQKWLLDFKAERYEQRSNWVFSGSGSPGLAPLSARIYQFGLSRRF